MDAVVLLNREAGALRGRDPRAFARSVSDAFGQGGGKADVRLVHPGGFDRELAAILEGEKRPDRLVVGGGDGTVSAAARALMGSDIALGLLPLGTLNLFARAIGMPMDPFEAVAMLPGTRARAIDMLEINGRAILMHASIGLQPHVIRQRERMTYRTRAGKMWHGVRAWVRVLQRPPRLRFSVRTSDAAEERAATAVLLSNNQLSQETGLVPVSGDPGSGELALYICTSPRRRDLVRLTLAVSFGAWRETGLVEEIVTDKAEINARRKRLLMSVDGELAMFDLPLKCRILPGCVSVLFPDKKQ